jgi:hypothetical protein
MSTIAVTPIIKPKPVKDRNGLKNKPVAIKKWELPKKPIKNPNKTR